MCTKPIQIDPHTLERAAVRGTDKAEIPDVIVDGFLVPAKYGRMGEARIYTFGRERGGKVHPQKRMEGEDRHGDRLRVLWPMGAGRMNINYNHRTDLLYIRLDERHQQVLNRRVSDDVVLDVGTHDRIVGIEIMNASHNLCMENVLPVSIEQAG